MLLSGGLAPVSATLLAEQARCSLPDALQEWLDGHLDTALHARLGCSQWMQARAALPVLVAEQLAARRDKLTLVSAQETLRRLLRADPAQRGSAFRLAQRCRERQASLDAPSSSQQQVPKEQVRSLCLTNTHPVLVTRQS